MKKHLFLIVLIVLSLSAFAKHVNVETARSVAKTFWTMNVQKGNMMKSSVEFADITSQTEFTNFYIFNTAGGFVIVSADDIATPILGYSDENEFDPTNIPVNAREWLQGYESDIYQGIANGLVASAEIAADWANLQSGMAMQAKGTRAVNKLLTTTWDQGNPYNTLCPYDNDDNQRTVTGCVATAMAQVMKYWNYPTHGNGSKSYNCSFTANDGTSQNPVYITVNRGQLSANFGTTTYDWANMPNNLSSSSTSAQKTAVATLMYHCGVSVEMSYDIGRRGGSGAVTIGSGATAETAFKNYFLYKNTLKGYYKSNFTNSSWINMLKTDLDANRPIIYSGRGEEGGHCFVCDGYNNSNQFHFNWGWSGYCDGFYALDAMEPGTGGIGAGNGTYNDNQGAILGIEPNSGLITIPNALTVSGLGGSATFLIRAGSSTNRWSASSSASWLTVSPTSGNGNGANTTVTATATRNNTETERSATITITHGTETATVTVTQPSGQTQAPGCFGNDDFDSFNALVNGNMFIIRSEGFGYFENGHKVTSVKFTTYNGSAIDNSYSSYTNNSFTIKIYENGSVEDFINSGYTTDINASLGNLVYTQNYTQTSFGEQEVTLTTPYTINGNKNFWIAIVTNGNSIALRKDFDYGDPVSLDSFSSTEAYNGKYLYVYTEDGTNYLKICSSANYADNTHQTVQEYGWDYTLSFCTIDPSGFEVTPTEMEFTAAGGNQSATVQAGTGSAGWTATSNASWLTVSPTSGQGNGTTSNVTITATRFTGNATRQGTITFTQGDARRTINVSQQGVCYVMHADRFASGSVVYTVRDGGYVCGANSYEDAAKAELFESTGSYAISSIAYKYAIQGSEGSVTFKVWGNNNGQPGEELASKNVTLATLYSAASGSGTTKQGIFTWTFTTPLTVSGNFFAGFDVSEATSYIGLYSTEQGSGYTNSCFEIYGTNWLGMTSSWGANMDISMYVLPSVCEVAETYTINTSVNPANSGTITGNNSPYESGDNVSLTASPNTGYNFVNWTENNTQVSTNANYQFTASANRTLVANFAPITYTIAVSANPTAGGTVTGGNTYNHGANVTVTATANTGYTFTNWTEKGNVVSTSANYQFTATANRTLKANFTINTYTIAVSANPTAGGTVTGGNTYNHGANVTVTATANTGYTFTNWTENGNVVSTNANYQFTATANRTLKANFTLNTYTIAATANPAAGGTVQGTGSYNHGAQVTLTAVAGTGYTFTNWTENGTVVSSDAAYQFTATANRTLVANFSLNSYTIAATADPIAGGSITGAGNYNHGANVTLTATANTGYTFTNWTENGNVVSNNAILPFTATANRNLVAHFTINSYNVAVSANPTEGGNVTGAGQYNHGANVTVTATANSHYSFVNWTENNAEVSTSASYSFAIAASRNLVANFQIDRFTITANSNNAEWGTVTGGGTYNYNATATLTATPAAHYHFVQWNDGNTQNPRTITVTENATYTATFAIDQHTITLVANPTIGGTVTGGGTFDWGTTTTITATAAEGYHFVSWSDDATAPASRSYTVNGNATLTANFVENQAVTYTITASATEGGSINPTGSLVVTEHSNQDYTIVANQYYNLTSVLVDGNEAISQLNDGVYSFTDITADHTIRAIFTEIPTYTVATSANPTEGGSTTGNGTFHQGENVTVAATANNHYTFVNWTENNAEVSATATYSFDIAANRNLVANFQIDRFTITANSNNAEWGTVTGGGEYDYNATVTLTATPAAHYHFVSWNDGNTQNQRTITVTENATYTATFAIDTHTITVTANGNGEVTGGGIKNYGDVITLTATANEGSHFVRWNDGVTESTRQHTVVADAEFIAYFAVDGATMYTVSAEANPTEGGTITGAGQYAENETATLTATANDGYHFLNWTEGTTTLSEEPTLTFVVTSDRNIVANFALNSYTIAASANPTEGGSITGARNYNHGENVTLTATANTGYNFVNWTEGGEVVSSEATLTFVATANRTLVANFEETTPVTYTITATAGNGGTITPDGTVTVVEGENQTFVIRPNEGYQVESISIDGEELVITTVITDSMVYTFNNVTENHTINVTFVNITASEIIEAGSISVFPNPNRGMFSIDFSAIEGNVTYQLINVNGSIIESREMNVSDGSEKSFSYNLAPGVYFVRIISGDKTYTKQVVVE